MFLSTARRLLPESAKSLARAARQRLKRNRSYNDLNALTAADLVALPRAKILVVGCNTGLDCRIFVRLGAREIHGLDVLDEIGSDFKNRRVIYHKQSIEQTDFPTGMFDLVYSVATMEHVPDIEAGFAELARLTKPGGTIYSVASPLWCSPYGHHMTCLEGHPWVHLAYDVEAS